MDAETSLKTSFGLPESGPVIVFDTEYTAWEGSMARGWSEPWEHREIVQIGAVKLDAATMQEEAALDLIVRPVLNPILSDYFIELTGVTNDRLSREGTTLAEAVDRLTEFMGPDAPALSNGNDWGMIEQNCTLLDMACGLPKDRCIDIRTPLQKAFAVGRPVDSYLLAGMVGTTVEGRAHDAVFDARSIAAALAHLRAQALI